MSSRKEVLCSSCNFPARRGALPVVIKATSTDRACYCSIACLEKSGVTLPEPLRTWHLEVEAAQNQ